MSHFTSTSRNTACMRFYSTSARSEYRRSMTVLALSMVILVAVNGYRPALAEGAHNDKKCLSTLEDFKKAYFRGDYYHSDSWRWRYYMTWSTLSRIGLTVGFYRLTYGSKENSTHTKWGECCYPSKDDNHCLVIIAFHSPVYKIFHPLLLWLLAMPYRTRIFFFGDAEIIKFYVLISSGVHCWNVPPVCSNRDSTVQRSLIDFSLQVSWHTCIISERKCS